MSCSKDRNYNHSKTEEQKLPKLKPPLYRKAILEAPDGMAMQICNRKKAERIVQNGLGSVVKEDPFTVRLNFEPSWRPEDPLRDRHNRCVVCGHCSDTCKQKYIVPKEYRKHFQGKYLKY